MTGDHPNLRWRSLGVKAQQNVQMMENHPSQDGK